MIVHMAMIDGKLSPVETLPIYPNRRAGQVAEEMAVVLCSERPPLIWGMGKDIFELGLVGNDDAFAWLYSDPETFPGELDSDGLEAWCMNGAPWIWDAMEHGW